MCQLTQTALKGFLAQKYKDENDCSDTTELHEDVNAGQRAAETVCQYVDWLLSTVNPNPPDDPRRAIMKVVMKSLGEKDYAAQETMHYLFSLKLHSSSFKVMDHVKCVIQQKKVNHVLITHFLMCMLIESSIKFTKCNEYELC